MLVSDLMRTEVVTVRPDDTLADAARTMLVHHVSGLPVAEAGKLVGIITEGDLLRRVEIGTAGASHGWLKAFLSPGRLANEFVRTHGRYVRDAMNLSPVTVTPDTELADVADLMCKMHVKRLPVVQRDTLVGVISRTDLLRVLASELAKTGDPYSAAGIKTHIMDILAQERWAHRSGIRVNVAGGTVALEGMVFSQEEQRAVRVIAETTPGVTEVHDNLVLIDPASSMSIPVA
jgi:CBS domain-containing protein